MNVKLHITADEVRQLVSRFLPNARRMESIAFYCHQQTKTRFETRGASGGHPWASPKWVKKVGHDDGRAILTGRRAQLLERFHSSGTDTEAMLGNDLPQSLTHQVGTVGKGGTMPDIRPKRAKALFIPLTDRAASSVPVTARGMRVRRATSGEQVNGVYRPLVRGRFVDGKIEPANADYIFLKKVSIPPRPMLPNSPAERADQTAFVIDTLKNGPQ